MPVSSVIICAVTGVFTGQGFIGSGRSRTVVLLLCVGLALTAIGLLIISELRKEKASREAIAAITARPESWLIKHWQDPPISDYSRRYPASYSQSPPLDPRLSWPLNPYSGEPVREVAPTQPSPGDFSYIPLLATYTLRDGRIISEHSSYYILLWGRRHRAVRPWTSKILSQRRDLPILAVVENGEGKRLTPVYDELEGMTEEHQTLDEALLAAGLAAEP